MTAIPMSWLAYTLLALLMWPAESAFALENELGDHPSPYLAMHGDDPVHWQSWSADAIARARETDKLLFVSIGYFACHWCHVMQRESYRDEAVAAFINEHFVPVKVDRELQPALDARLIEFVERTRGYSGWPLNVFLTPEGYPLVGLVYLPRDEFKSLLESLAERWARNADSLRATARAAAVTSQAPARAAPAKAPEAESVARLRATFVRQTLAMGDSLEGGFFEPNKFPMAPQLRALLHVPPADDASAYRAFLIRTLDQMREQGLRDHLRGGFYRYTVDPAWQIPHFEKMLYDNALLAQLYLEAGRRLHRKDYLATARETLDFMIREMRDAGTGAFISSLSAVDDNDVEGGFYVWDDATLERLLTAQQLQVARLAWAILDVPDLEHGHHLTRGLTVDEIVERLERSPQWVKATLDAAAERLRQAQTQRSLPRDTKVLGAWNALALVALVQAMDLHDTEAYRVAAARVASYLSQRLWNGERLLRARVGDRAVGEAALEDYAYVSAGLWAWAQASGDEQARRAAHAIANSAWVRFYSAGAWSVEDRPLIPLLGREPALADGPLPSPSALLIETSLAMAEHFKDDSLKRQAWSALQAAMDAVSEEPFWLASYVRVLDAAVSPEPQRVEESAE